MGSCQPSEVDERDAEVADVDERIVLAGIEADAAQRFDRAVEVEHGPARRRHRHDMADLGSGHVGADLERSDARHAALALRCEPIDGNPRLRRSDVAGQHGIDGAREPGEPAAPGRVEQVDVADVGEADGGCQFAARDRPVCRAGDVVVGPGTERLCECGARRGHDVGDGLGECCSEVGGRPAWVVEVAETGGAVREPCRDGAQTALRCGKGRGDRIVSGVAAHR